MKKIEIFFGSNQAFEKYIPQNSRNLSEMATVLDNEGKQMEMIVRIPGQEDPKPKRKKKPRVQNFVIFADEYCSVHEHVIINFANFISKMSITNMYIQNPPKTICDQIYRIYKKEIINEVNQSYVEISEELLINMHHNYCKHIIGQEDVKDKLIQAMYPLVGRKQEKPVVVLLYGDSGLGKTETAQYISRLLQGKLFRRQLSMYQNSESANYIFGGKYNEKSFAHDLLARETNVILLDEFDKALSMFHSAFYQLFDEGIYEDHNYKVEMKRSLIICTSNYKSIEEIKDKLGLPIYNRFDSIIRFNNLSEEAKKKIADKEIKAFKEDYKVDDEKLIIRLENACMGCSNAREIRHLVKDTFSLLAIRSFLYDKEVGVEN